MSLNTSGLLEVAQAVGGTLDLAEALRRVCRALAHITGAETVSIHLVDERRDLRPAAAYHVPKDALEILARSLLPLSEQGFASTVFEAGEVVWSDDVQHDPRFAWSLFRQFPHQSGMMIPLLLDGTVTGCFYLVWWRARRSFEPADLAVLKTVGRLVGLLLQNARLVGEAERRRQRAEDLAEDAARRLGESETLAELARAINASLDVEIVLRRITEAGRRLSRSDAARIALWEPDREVMRVRFADGDAVALDSVLIQPGMGVRGRVLVTGKPFLTDDYLSDVRIGPEYREEAAAEGLQSLLVVPIVIEGRVEGLLSVSSRTAARFTDRDRAILCQLADHAAIAITNARLYEDGARRLREAEILAELARTINASLDLDTILPRVVAAARELCGSDIAFVALKDPGAAVARFRAWTGTRRQDYGRFEIVAGKGSGGHVLATGQPFRTDDYPRDPRISPDYRSVAQEEGVAAQLVVPIRIDARVEGFLAVNERTRRAYTDREEAVLERLAEQAAVAIKNAVQTARERSLQEQLLQAQKMEAVGRLAGGIAHDFNNLLTVITGRAELLLDQLVAGSRSWEALELIRKTADRAATLTRQLLAFSRKQVLQPKIITLNDTVSGLGSMLRRLIGEDIDLVTRLDPMLGRVKADPGQIEQVLVNLSVNARDAMPKGGRLVIETRNVRLETSLRITDAVIPPGTYAALEVSDTGVGMDAGTLAQVFEPFFTTKGVGKGTGLGLSTAHGIVRQHGGFIAVRSDPGQGATFTIYLPGVAEPVAEAEGDEARATRAGSETILVVEDERGVCDLTEDILRGQGYTVLTAATPERARMLCRRYPAPIHLLLTDVVMPSMSGPELARELVSTRPAMRVLYMSGYTDEALQQHRIAEEGVPFLEKPFTRARLAQKVLERLAPREGGAAAAGAPRAESARPVRS
jgi:GAF domain-containing protein/ActR/RegA family two-component response regulator